MEKAFPTRVNWQNLPNKTTPINQENLNKSDAALRIIDDRVITLDAVKFDKSSANALIKNFQLNQSTGVITITWYDNSTATFDTALEKIAVNFDYDDDPTSAHYQSLILYDKDGQVLQYIDLSSLITEYEFDDTSTIAFTRTQDGHIKAQIKTGSVTEDLLQSNYLADITRQAQIASSSAQSAESDASDANYYKNLAMSYAVGTNGQIRDIDITDNAKSYKEDSEAWSKGTRNGVPVSSADETYHNNAKYWSEQSSTPIMTNEMIGKGRPDGITTDVTEGVFRAKGVAIYCTVNPDGTEHAADWLKYGTTIIIPSNIQLYMVYINEKPTLWAWDGIKYVMVSASGSGGLVSILKADYDALPAADKNDPDIWWWITDVDGSVSSTTVGGGGTTNYNDLINKPKINDVELSGNKSLDDLSINLEELPDTALSNPQEGQNLQYDATNEKWVNGNVTQLPSYRASISSTPNSSNPISLPNADFSKPFILVVKNSNISSIYLNSDVYITNGIQTIHPSLMFHQYVKYTSGGYTENVRTRISNLELEPSSGTSWTDRIAIVLLYQPTKGDDVTTYSTLTPLGLNYTDLQYISQNLDTVLHTLSRLWKMTTPATITVKYTNMGWYYGITLITAYQHDANHEYIGSGHYLVFASGTTLTLTLIPIKVDGTPPNIYVDTSASTARIRIEPSSDGYIYFATSVEIPLL